MCLFISTCKQTPYHIAPVICNRLTTKWRQLTDHFTNISVMACVWPLYNKQRKNANRKQSPLGHKQCILRDSTFITMMFEMSPRYNYLDFQVMMTSWFSLSLSLSHTHTHTHTYIHIHTHTHIYIYIYIHTHIYIYIYTHTHTHTQH